MNRFLLSLSLAATLSAPVLAEGGQRSLTAEEAVQIALTGNPELMRERSEVDVAKARLTGALLLFQGNPSVTATAGPRQSPAGSSRDESLQVLQPIEISGQKGARIEAARASLDAAEARLAALRAEVAAEIREAFGRALAAEQRARLAAEALGIAQAGVAAAQERFDVGAAALLEVNAARVELGRSARDRGVAERRSAESKADLHLLLGLDPAEVFALKGELRADAVATLAEPRLIEEALANRAEIAANQRALDAANAEARLAEREAVPTPRFGVSYTREQESDTRIFQGLVSIDLPLFNRNQAARGIAAARITQLETERDATSRRVRQDVSTALARLQAARAAAGFYADDVVKAMLENMELGTESYRAGKIDFLQLLFIRRQALEARREHIDVLEELNAALNQLDRAVGKVSP